MKKTFLDLGMQPLANNFSKKYTPASFRLKLKFDTDLKLVMINKHMKKEKCLINLIHIDHLNQSW